MRAVALTNDQVDTTARSPSSLDVHVGSRVRMRRLVLGMSQERLGELLGITFQQVQKYEKGVNRIGASRLFELTRALGVPVQFFFDQFGEASEEATVGSPVDQLINSKEVADLVRAFARIGDTEQRRALVSLAETLAASSPK